MIPVFSNSLGKEEADAVQRVMQSHWLGMGPECVAFERELAHHFGVERLHSVNCATSGIYLALRCLNLERGQEVIIPSIHFVACAGAVLELGGVPVFADVDPHTLNITGKEIKRLRTSNTAGVIVNHYGGHPAPMAEIMDASWWLWVLEDAANAPATKYHGQAVGTIGDAGIWSFDAMKILCMADGGALWLRDEDAHRRAWRLRNLGLDSLSGADKAEKVSSRWWEFTVKEPSPRYDSNDLLAAIGRVQLGKLARMVSARKRVWSFYQEHLEGVGDLALPPEPAAGCEGSYYLYWIQTAHRDALARFLYENGIYTTFRYYPLHWAFGYKEVRLPYSEQIAEVTLCLPLHQNITETDSQMIVAKVREFYGQ